MLNLIKIKFFKSFLTAIQWIFKFIFLSLIINSVSVAADPKLTVSMANKLPSGNNNNPNLLGTNILYWIDDDKVWNTHKLGNKLQQLSIKTLRYPGGEVADNYDWETNSLENPKVFPKAAPDLFAKSQRLDYIEFLEHAKKINANKLFFVVNLEGAFIAKGDLNANILRYAKNAARWVQAVKQRGYKVQYWEIGNESYLRAGVHPLTSFQYAKALKVFSREMKKVDPNIKIGAIGPESTNAKGFLSSLTKKQLAYFRKTKNACKKHRSLACVRYIQTLIPGVAKPKPWWDVLAKEAGNSFDFVAVHDYSLIKGLLKSSLKIKKLREHIIKKLGKNIEFTVTEWNSPNPRKVKLSALQGSILNTIKLGNYLASGVDYTMQWPLQYKNNDYRTLFSFEKFKATTLFDTFELIQPAISGQFVNHVKLDKEVYFLQTVSKKMRYALLVNRGNSTKDVFIKLANNAIKNVEIKLISKKYLKGRSSYLKMEQGRETLEMKLGPQSITVLKVSRY